MPLNATSHKADSQICLCSVIHLTHALLYNLKLTEELQRLLKMSYWWLWSNLENKREKTWDSYFQSNFTASYIITKYILLITYKFPDCQIHMFFTNSVWFCIAQKHKRPASFLCSLTESSFLSRSLPFTSCLIFFTYLQGSTFLLSHNVQITAFHASLFTFL